MAPRKIVLQDGEWVLGTWAENLDGHGWTNYPVWVAIGHPSGKWRIEALQPDEQSSDLVTLRDASSAIAKSMLSVVKAHHLAARAPEDPAP